MFLDNDIQLLITYYIYFALPLQIANSIGSLKLVLIGFFGTIIELCALSVYIYSLLGNKEYFSLTFREESSLYMYEFFHQRGIKHLTYLQNINKCNIAQILKT